MSRAAEQPGLDLWRRPAFFGVAATLVTATVASIGIVILGALAERQQLDELRRALGQTATTAAALIDARDHQRHVQANHMSIEEYDQAVLPLRSLRTSNPDIVFAFTGVIRDQRMFYVLDADPRDISKELLEAETTPPLPDELRAWDSKSLIVEQAPTATQWGVGLRAYAPIRDATGERVAYVGLTLRASRYAEARSTLRKAVASGMAASLLLAIVTGAFAFRMQRDRHRAMQAALAASQAKSRFLANMSHEIRTPLNGIIGSVELLQHTKLQPQQSKYAANAANCADALLDLVSNVLDLAKIEAQKISLELGSFELQQLLEQSLSIVAPRALAKGLDLTCSVEPDQKLRLIGDSNRIRQILLNLLGNAVKFTERGRVQLRVNATFPDSETASLRFEVRDTGIGIDSEAQARLFQPFSQADESTTRRFGGTGLGLTIARELVHLLAGDLGFRSARGAGSVFWFTVPVRRDASIAASMLPADAAILTPRADSPLRHSA
jgi:signal transduction histidine kinase